MKYFLVTFLLVFAIVTARAQNTPDSNFTYQMSLGKRLDSSRASKVKFSSFLVAKELRQYNTMNTTGKMLDVFGTGLIGIGALTANTPSKITFICAGIGVDVVGFCVQLIAGKHLKKTAILLQGNSVSISLNKRHRTEHPLPEQVLSYR